MGVDEQKATAYEDDPEIRDDTLAYRRVNPNWINWDVRDEAGNPRVTSQAFQDCTATTAERLGVPGPGMSVGLSVVLDRLGLGPAKILELVDKTYGVVALNVLALRELNQGLHPWPTDHEPWHGIVFDRAGKKRGKTTCAAIAALSTWVLVPDK